MVTELQSEIASLYAKLADEKERLQDEKDARLKEAKAQVESIKAEYDKYKVEISQKLENAVSPTEVAQMEEQVRDSRERAESFRHKLDEALAKLRQNRHDRQMLQGEMVALRQGYISKLNEIEDQLEFAQDERVREQQKGAERIAALEEESRQKLKEAIEDGRKKVEELTLQYTRKLAAKSDELAQTKAALREARETVQQKEDVILRMEKEAQSIRKLMKKSLSLAKGRVTRRLRSLVPRRKEDEDDTERRE